jgi:sugar lactone lactonase YvrE
MAIFVNTNNTVYIASTSDNRILVFSEGSMTPMRNISDDLISPSSLFVTVDGNIYADNRMNNRVDMWTSNATNSVPVMYLISPCFGLFVDIANNLYCSSPSNHRVIKKSLDDQSNTSMTVAGVGSNGSASDMLSFPVGIFVDINFDLYVADSGNDRIQLFRYGQLNGITVVGSGSSTTTITLKGPTGIVLDADNYLFIADRGNHRIIGSGPNGFRCLVGCSGSGSASNQLGLPSSLSFDSYGNIFVVDLNNNRVQKFILEFNSCGKCKNI